MRYFIEHRISAWMAFACLVLFGAIGVTKLPVSLTPPSTDPGVTAIIEYPGVTPDRIETVIARPVERVLRTIPGIRDIHSVSEDGRCRLDVIFHRGTDMKIAPLLVREKIALVQGSFPRAVQDPLVSRYDPSRQPVLIATLEDRTGAMGGLTGLREFAERKLKPRLLRLDGVSEVVVAGGMVREIRIDMDRGRLEACGLSPDDISRSAQSANVSIPSGMMNAGGREHALYVSGRYDGAGSIGLTPVCKAPNGGSVTIGDIGTVSDSFRDREDIARLDGSERVMLYVHRAGDASVLDVCERAREALRPVQEVSASVIYDQGGRVRASLNNVLSSALWGLAIVMASVYCGYRRFLPVLAVGLTIPVSLVSIFAFMYFARVPVDVMSLAGLAVGVGMVVDNGIIVTESVFGNNASTVQSIACAVDALKTTLVCSTLTTIIAFVPVAFGDDTTRTLYGPMAFTIACALIISLFAACALTPSVYAGAAARAGRRAAPHRLPLSSGARLRLAALNRALASVESRAAGSYRTMLTTACAHPRRVLAAALLPAFLAMAAAPFLKSGFFDPVEGHDLHIICELPPGATLTAADRAAGAVESILRSHESVSRVSSRVEKSRASFTVTIRNGASGRSRLMASLQAPLNRALRPYGGFAYLTEADESAARELSVSFAGDDNETLRTVATRAASAIGAMPGIADCVLRFREGRPSYRISIDRARCAASGVSASAVAGHLHGALHGPVITRLVDGDREIDVRMRFQREQSSSIERILDFAVTGDTGVALPLGETVTVREEHTPTKIWRHNGRREVTVTARIDDTTFDEAADCITRALHSVQFPEGYSWRFDGTYERMKEARSSAAAICALSVLLVFMLLASLFESLALPLIIMTAVPLAFSGSAVALCAARMPVGMPVYMGLVMLAGIAVNNGIVLTDAITRRLRAGVDEAGSAQAVIIETSVAHFRPVMLTTVSTVLGLLPSLLMGGAGSELWRGLSLAVISGLAVSTALTLTAVPLACLYYHAFQTRRNDP